LELRHDGWAVKAMLSFLSEGFGPYETSFRDRETRLQELIALNMKYRGKLHRLSSGFGEIVCAVPLISVGTRQEVGDVLCFAPGTSKSRHVAEEREEVRIFDPKFDGIRLVVRHGEATVKAHIRPPVEPVSRQGSRGQEWGGLFAAI